MSKTSTDKSTHTPSPMTAREYLIRNMPGGGHEACSVTHKETSLLHRTVRLHCTCGATLSVPLDDTNTVILQNVPEGKLGSMKGVSK